MTTKALPTGSFPTMITPFTDEGAIDWSTLESLTEWYIAAGCTGLFACCLSSEMYNLSNEERLELAAFVNKVVAGRASVVGSGTFEGSVEEQAAFCTKMAEHVDAVVVLTCQMAAETDSDEVWKSNVNKLLELTTCSLGLYECPVPYKRVVSPDLLQWAAETGRFLFHKDTCCDTDQIKAKIEATQKVEGSPFRFYNANVETLLFSNELGGAGFSGISANFYPYLHAKLCAIPSVLSEDQKKKIQRFLSVAEEVVCVNYPASAKTYLALHEGFPIGAHCRKGEFAFNEVQLLHLQHMKEMAEDLAKDCGIDVVAPVAKVEGGAAAANILKFSA
jgi:4-hydroxy-tetrahydrodipicolinate synthase